jgi:PKHD-type hydroxylase
MNLEFYYWYFTSVLSTKFCDDLIAYGKSKQEQVALVGGTQKILQKKEKLSKKELKNLQKVRNSNVAWLNDTWIYNEIHPYINTANKNAGWNFNWDWSESCQFTKYKLNQYYDWHVDAWNSAYENKNDLNSYGKIRKLSVTCSLSNPKDYEGGELEFSIPNKEPKEEEKIYTCKEILPKGSIVVFPSFVWHRVKPVTKGTRYSLVVWNLGYPYK